MAAAASEERAANGGPQKDDVPENANENCPGASSEGAGQAAACAGCPNQSICAAGGGKQAPDPDLAVIKERLACVKHKLLVLSGKGGVGKSTVSSQLALGFAEMGYQVGLLDIDLCGPSIPRMMGLQGSDIHSSAAGWEPVYVSDSLGVMSIGFMLPGEDEAVIWRGPRKNGLIKQFLRDVNWGEIDFLIVDTPPGTSDEHLSIVQYLQMDKQNDGCVLVTTPQEVAMADVRKEANFCRKVDIRMIGVIENMSEVVLPVAAIRFVSGSGDKDETESVLSALRNAGLDPSALCIAASILDKRQGGAESFQKRTGVPVLGSIPMDPELGRASEDGQFAPEGSAAGNSIEKILQSIENAFH